MDNHDHLRHPALVKEVAQHPSGPVHSGKTGVAVIGCGNFARRIHLPNLGVIPEARLAAVCDVDPKAAEEAATLFGAEAAVTSPEALWEDPGIEVVVVAVRDHIQAAITQEALRAGRHVYVEKPGGQSDDDFRLVEESALYSGCRVAVGFNKRFAPAYQLARQVMEADGGPRNLYFRMADDAWRWAKGYPPGALLRHDLCHLFDLLRWFTSAEVSTVYCRASRPEDDALLIQMSNGTVATMLQSGHATMDMPKEYFEAICARGSVIVEDYVELRTHGYPAFQHKYRFAGHACRDGQYLHRPLFARQGIDGMSDLRRIVWELRNDLAAGKLDGRPEEAGARQFLENTLPNFLRDQGWLASLRSFLIQIRQGGEIPHAGIADARAASRIADAAELSRETGKVVQIGTHGLLSSG